MARDSSEIYYTTLRQYVNSIQKNTSLLDYHIFEDSFSDEYMNELKPYFQKVYKKPYHTSHMFFGNKNSGSSWHYANNENVFIEIYGVKHWCFINIHEWIFMRAWASDFSYQRAYPPYLEKIPHSCVSLYPGDILYMPSWTWHQVQNLGTLNLGIANRITPLFKLSEFRFPYDLYNLYYVYGREQGKSGDYLIEKLVFGNENTTVEDRT